MPQYDFSCNKCEHSWTFLKLKTDEKLPQKCPECGSPSIEKDIPRGTSFQLKGRGWFRDGYKGKGN